MTVRPRAFAFSHQDHIEDGQNRMQRCYTIASSPSDEGFCEITIKREGVASGLMHDRIDRGSRLAVAGPMGRFAFDGEAAQKVVFIAGGVGITPLMSHIRFLLTKRWPGRIDLFYSVKTSHDIIFREELKSLSDGNANFRVHFTITSGDDTWSGRRGRLSSDWLSALVPDLADCEIRLCGPAAMATRIRDLTRSLGVPNGQFDVEVFGGRSEPNEGSTEVRDLKVRFDRSRVSASASNRQTLLEVALAAGVRLDHGCRAGVCGRCKVRLIVGDAAAGGDFALTSREKEDGFILACQCRPQSDIVLDC